MPLRTGIGAAHDAVSTTVPQALAYYDQGLAYLHSYVWVEAARSFHHALKLDPTLAMADVGLSVAYTELNAPALARAALDRARARGADLTDHDRRHLDARAAQMAAGDEPHAAGRLAAYRQVLDEALARFPSDEEFWGQGSVAGSMRFYERALALAPEHFAAHHYLTHAFENAGRFEEALTHAAAYARMAPAIPHAHHMHGHALRRTGRIDEAVAAFEAADRLEIAYVDGEGIPAEYDWHYHHNLDLLGTSYRYLGQMQHAERLLSAAFAIPSALLVQVVNKREWPEFLLARGRVNEALAAANRLIAHASPVVRATGHVEAGHAMLVAGRFPEAAAEANAALRELESASDGAAQVATSLERLQGEFFLRTGKTDKGRALLDDVATKVRAAPGPDAWSDALFTLEAIGRAARDVGDWELAGRMAQQMREHDPAYAGTQYALGLVADHAGDARAARAAFALAAKYWSKADADLPELADIRARAERAR
ncbi:MAG: hypothetical protein DMF91_22605 [Acidobacteria bacterium]|nr:MAG: hypothetical protein DMF91_22605 [Acidobacteriota bacterium]